MELIDALIKCDGATYFELFHAYKIYNGFNKMHAHAPCIVYIFERRNTIKTNTPNHGILGYVYIDIKLTAT